METGPGQHRDTGSQEPLRDWQRETWYGPYPVHENPFDEPENAPELRDLRSEELNNRSGEFWQTQTNGYQFGNRPAQRETPVKTAKPKPVSRRRKLIRAAALLLGMTAVLLVLHFVVFTVKTINVQGISEIPPGEVIRLSGIRQGMPVLSLDEKAIARGIEQNPKLKFRYLERSAGGNVTIRVREREACCWMTWNGILYTMDKQRTVLFESEVLPDGVVGRDGTPTLEENDQTKREEQERVEKLIANLVRVDGLSVRSGTMVGQSLMLEESEQQTAFSELFLEMKVLSCTGLIQEVDLSNLNSLLMTTRDGFTVALGNSSDIHAKLRSMLLTREELLRRNYHGGVINVTLPATPIFSPVGE